MLFVCILMTEGAVERYCSPVKVCISLLMSIIYDKFNRPHKLEDLNAVEAVFKLKQKSGSSPWPVIEKLIKIWSSKNPQKWDSYLYYLEETKKTRKVTAYGNSQFSGMTKNDKVHGGILRYTVDMPEPLYMMIRMVYSHEELPMDKEFMAAF